MNNPGGWIVKFFDGIYSCCAAIGWSARHGRFNNGRLICLVSTGLLCGAGVAYGGPCMDQIAQLEQQINAAPGPETGPTGTQTVGAQLHRQPTPSTVEHAEHAANSDANAALDRARKADADGNADECKEAIRMAKRIYGIE